MRLRSLLHLTFPGVLLIAPEAELCARCHGPVEKLPELHRRPEVAGASCSSCHDPHAQPAKKTAAGGGGAYVHEPYAKADCKSCHTDLPAQPAKLTAAKEQLRVQPTDEAAKQRIGELGGVEPLAGIAHDEQ